MSNRITTVEELDALPEGSIVLDREGDAWRKSGRWWLVGARDPDWDQAASVVAKYAPLRPIHVPGRDLIREAKAEAWGEGNSTAFRAAHHCGCDVTGCKACDVPNPYVTDQIEKEGGTRE